MERNVSEKEGCGPLLRDLALYIRRRAIARPWKIHGLARGEQMPPPSRPSLAGSLLRSAAIPSYYRNIRFNGERQGITMRDTTPKRAIFHPGIPFFLSFFLPSFLPPPRPSGVNSNPRYVSHPTMVFDVYGFRRA